MRKSEFFLLGVALTVLLALPRTAAADEVGDEDVCGDRPVAFEGHLRCKVPQLKGGPAESVIYADGKKVVIEPAAASLSHKPAHPIETDPIAWATTPGTTAAPHIAILEFGSTYCNGCQVMHQALDMVSQACATPNVKVVEALDGGIWDTASTPAQAHANVPDVGGCEAGGDCEAPLRSARLWTEKSHSAGTLVAPSHVHPVVVYPPDPPKEMEREFKALGLEGNSWPVTVVLVNGHVAYVGREGPVNKTQSLANERAAAKKMVSDMKAGVSKHLPLGVTHGLDCDTAMLDGSSL